MKRFITFLIVVALSGVGRDAFSQTSLTATEGTPTLDGVESPGEWTSGMITTAKGLSIKSMIDDQYLYVLATWDDATSTKNVDKNQWSFDGASWSQAGDEDRVGIIWDMGLNGSEGANCATMCHPPLMSTATGKVDVWHWKAARTNPLGFADDKHWLTDGRHGDAGSGIDSKNSPMGSGFPSLMGAQDPGANLAFLLGDAAALAGFDPFGVISGTADTTAAFDSTATFASGAVIPGRILSLPTGNRASVRSAGKYDSGKWTVEFKRLLDSDADDFQVVRGGSVKFTTEIFNNEGSTHLNDGFDTTVFTLNFPAAAGSGTSLTAGVGTPTLDGVASPGEWTSDMITTSKGLTIKSMIDENNLYVLATWMDATSTENFAKNQWSFDGASWSQAGDEDRVGIIWDMGLNGSEGANCATMCHPPLMSTATGKVDVWHWKAARTNPLGFADDKHWLTDGRHGDAGSGIDSKNSPMGSGFPSLMGAQDPGANLAFLLGDAAALAGFDPFGVISGTADTTAAFDSTATFATGAVIPGRILSMPTGNRASVLSAGKYDNGLWTVEFSRPLVSDADDFEVVPGGSVQFTTEIFDNQGSTHLNDGFDTTVFTMNFPTLPTTKTSLTATIGTPTLDGIDSPGEWTSDMITTTKGLTIKSMVDDDFFYVLAKWMDATSTKNVAKNQWSFDGTSWSQADDEDRVGIIWDMGLNGSEGANCATMCHPPLMSTATGKVDVWHWKAARTNPLGFADDKHWLTDGRHGDAGSGIDSKNSPVGSGFPSFMAAADPGANVSFLAGDQAALDAFNPFGALTGTMDLAVTFDSTAAFSTGATIAGRILKLPTGNRASVRSAGKYDSGEWTVEFRRPIKSDGDDFRIISEGSVEFTTEIFDNQGSTHSNDGFDTTVYTLNFPVVTGVESEPDNLVPEVYTLHQNYPNPFNPSTTITFNMVKAGRVVLKIYNLLGQEVTTLVDKDFESGGHKVDFDASSLGSGVYIYRLSVNGFSDMKKMVLIK